MTSPSEAATYLQSLLAGIVRHPESLSIAVETDGPRITLEPRPDPSDISRIYGKRWATWAAVVQLVNAYTGCHGTKVFVKPPSEPLRGSIQESTNGRKSVAV